MMDGAAVKEIASLAQGAQCAADRAVVIGEHTLSTTPLHHIAPKPEAEPAVLAFASLQALSEYVKANRDELALDSLIIHVASPTSVFLRGPLVGEKKQRMVYASAECKSLTAGWLGQYHAQEDFVVALQSRFTPVRDRAAVLKVVSKLKDEQTIETEDDGVTQRASVKAGIHLAAQVEVPNPVALAPYRTFREVAQPESAFVLRIQKGPRCALFEADGGAWELDAVERVASWLTAAIPEIPILR